MAGREVIYDYGGALSTIEGFLKRDYVRDRIRTLINTGTYFLSLVDKRRKQATYGERWELPVKTGAYRGGGGRAELQALPYPSFGEYDKLNGNVKYLYYPFRITGPTIKATMNNRGAFANALTRAIEDTKEGAALDKQRQIWGDGTAVLGEVQTSVTGTTIAVTNPYGLAYVDAELTGRDKTMTMHRNLPVWFYTDGGGGTDQFRTITGVNPSAGTITVNSSVTVVAGDLIHKGDAANNTSVGNELTGISKILQTTGTYFGLTRDNNPALQANVVQYDDTLSLEDQLQAVDDTIFINGTEPYDLIITGVGVRSQYVRELQVQRRQVNPMKLQGGFTGIEFGGKALVVDKDAPPQRAHFFRTEDMNWFTMGQDGWLEEDGHMLKMAFASGNRIDAWEAFWAIYEEFVTEAPANQALLYDIVPPADI